jgi:hypothetical protein
LTQGLPHSLRSVIPKTTQEARRRGGGVSWPFQGRCRITHAGRGSGNQGDGPPTGHGLPGWVSLGRPHGRASSHPTFIPEKLNAGPRGAGSTPWWKHRGRGCPGGFGIHLLPKGNCPAAEVCRHAPKDSSTANETRRSLPRR